MQGEMDYSINISILLSTKEKNSAHCQSLPHVHGHQFPIDSFELRGAVLQSIAQVAIL